MSEQQFPEPICSALIFNPENKIFLMKSHKWGDKYVVPGGHVELGEKIEDALIREIKEETGLEIFEIKYVCFHESIYDDAFWKKRHFIFFDFTCRTKSTKVELNAEGQESVWVSIEDVLRLSTAFTKKTINQYLKSDKNLPLHGTGQ